MTTQEQCLQTTVIESEIPPFETFREEIMKIYPEGDLFMTYERIIYFITQVKTCEDGRTLTYQLIMDKFSEHIKAWNMVYGRRDPKYWGRAAEEKRKALWDFIESRWYEREFVTSAGNGERNSYLFGEFSINYLKNKLEEFKKRIHDETCKKKD